QSGNEQGMTVPDPYFGYRYRPDLMGQLSREDLNFTFTTDDHGFRNPSPWPEQADVVAVGDSMVFGYGVEDEQAWPRLVAKELPDTEIVNLGLIGAAPQQYLRVLEAFGLALHPKLVLFMLFPGNDLIDADAFQRWLDERTKLSYEEWRRTDGQPRYAGLLQQLLGGSRVLAFLRGARNALTSPVTGSDIEFEDGRRIRLAPAMLYSSLERDHPGDPVFELVMTTIERARTVSRRHGSHFLVLLMPTKEEVYLPRIGEPAPPLVETFKTELEKREVRFTDLTPYFRARSRDAAPLFFEIDGHPNAAGYRLIARVVADHLKEFGATYGLSDRPESTGRRDQKAGWLTECRAWHVSTC
ncbi:MAG: GDSL-type esterase/lipase family protein, partial [Geminicoccaceae bacterium]